MTINEVLTRTDWKLLAEQKRLLIEMTANLPAEHPLEGLINWMDELQDAAEAEGFPVVFLTETEEENEQ